MFTSDSLKSGLSVLGCAVLLVGLSACGLVRAPEVVDTDPADGANGVPVNTEVSATFNTWMHPETINSTTFTVMQGNTPVPGEVTYSDLTAVFTPTNALAPNTQYTARITTGAQALLGGHHAHSDDKFLHPFVGYLALAHHFHGRPQHDRERGLFRGGLASDVVWSFTTGTTTGPDVTAPRINSTVPANGATAVTLGRNLSASFTEAMDPATINTSTFTLSRGSVPVPGEVNYANVTAVFNPSTNLASNTLYTARVTTGAEDLAGNALAADFVWTFTTGATLDTATPSVSFTDPANGATDVPPNKLLNVAFSEAMDPTTIDATTFTLRLGSSPISGTVTYTGVTAVFAPFAPLLPGETYTATVHQEATDLSGNELASDFVWTFSTGDAVDAVRPFVSFTDPANAAMDVPPNKRITATFSEVMNPLSINAATFTMRLGSAPILGTVTYTGVTAVFAPFAPLLPDETYTVTIHSEARDLAGNELASDFVWSFSTGDAPDTTAPLVSFTDPENGAMDVPPNKRITATFTEVMNPLSINAATFTMRLGSEPILGTVTYTGVTAVFAPFAPLLPDETYTATVHQEARDLAGNELMDDFEWTFSTGDAVDAIRPFVTTTDPENGATEVPPNKRITATFSEVMDPLSINAATFRMRLGSEPILGTVTYSGVTAVFAPFAPLLPDETYTATVMMEAADLAGNGMVEDVEWSFTTGASLDTTSPTVTDVDPQNNAVGVPINKRISATFSKVMDPLTVNTTNFTVSQGATPVLGTVSYEGFVATFTPLVDLTPDTAYTVRVWQETTDTAGNELSSDFEWQFTTGITTAQDAIDLGSTNAFAVLAGSTVSSTGATTINGDLGVSPGTAVTGFPPGVLNGDSFTGAASAAGQAKEDLVDAFNEAASRSSGSVSLPGDLSGLTLYPGLYTNSTSVMLSDGAVTLDAQGDANAVFLFKMGSTLTTAPATQVILSGGANAANIYWQVGTSATLGTTSAFQGNILAQESITMATGSTLDGRALTQTAAVSLDAATITTPAP